LAVALASLAVALTAPVLSQTRQAQTSFEVASVKLNPSRPMGMAAQVLGCNGTDSHSPGTMNIPIGRCAAKLTPLRLVIALAYDIPPAFLYPYEGKVIAGPDWINSEMYDIDAKAETPATQAELKLMLQQLLAERFKLKLHREPREMPVYALVVNKGGHKLHEAPKDRDCGGQLRRDHRFELGATSLTGHCHAFIPEDGQLRGQSVDMSDFAEMLSIWAGRMVVDRTGVSGVFDLKMPRVAPAGIQVPLAVERNPNAGLRGEPAGGGEIRLAMESLPTVFTAVEQMGLKLEPSKGSVDVLVIDSIERPSQN
jgi:uncharacterized protein (TIGR03435 family)